MEGDLAAALSDDDDDDDGEIERCDLLFWQRERRLEYLFCRSRDSAAFNLLSPVLYQEGLVKMRFVFFETSAGPYFA